MHTRPFKAMWEYINAKIITHYKKKTSSTRKRHAKNADYVKTIELSSKKDDFQNRTFERQRER